MYSVILLYFFLKQNLNLANTMSIYPEKQWDLTTEDYKNLESKKLQPRLEFIFNEAREKIFALRDSILIIDNKLLYLNQLFLSINILLFII